jgi:hypothetical protein
MTHPQQGRFCAWRTRVGVPLFATGVTHGPFVFLVPGVSVQVKD